jgi:hypothetical protein
MAICELNIIFDNKDRRYNTHEPVSGKVVVKANKDFTGRDLQLAIAWRTRGQGNKDEGGKGSIWLAKEDLAIRSGDVR